MRCSISRGCKDGEVIGRTGHGSRARRPALRLRRHREKSIGRAIASKEMAANSFVRK
jgi:hypothetical protein